MNSFELNKVLGAILGTCLITLALNIAAGAIFSTEKPAKPGYAIAVKQEGGGEKAAPKEQEPSMEAMMATATVEKGQQIAKQCQACHTFEKGGPNRVGPNLWGIVGSPRGEDRGGFNFSAAMRAKGGNLDLQRALSVPEESARIYPRHGHDLCRSVARPAARRRDRFPQLAVRQPSAVAEGRGKSGARRRARSLCCASGAEEIDRSGRPMLRTAGQYPAVSV